MFSNEEELKGTFIKHGLDWIGKTWGNKTWIDKMWIYKTMD